MIGDQLDKDRTIEGLIVGEPTNQDQVSQEPMILELMSRSPVTGEQIIHEQSELLSIEESMTGDEMSEIQIGMQMNQEQRSQELVTQQLMKEELMPGEQIF